MRSPVTKLENYIFDNWYEDRKYFLGRVLTIVDASISDKEQRKGIKDLIHDAFYGKNYRMEEVKDILLQFVKKYLPDKFDEYQKNPLSIPMGETASSTPEDYFAEIIS